MGRVMIECPNTGVVVPTDLAFDQETFGSLVFEASTFDACIACGGTHTFSKQEAWVEEEAGPSR